MITADRSGGTLRGQKALVTGASSGIGLAIAVALGQAGADVVVNYVSHEDEAAAAVEEIRRAGVRSFAHRADISREAEVRPMFERAIADERAARRRIGSGQRARGDRATWRES